MNTHSSLLQRSTLRLTSGLTRPKYLKLNETEASLVDLKSLNKYELDNYKREQKEISKEEQGENRLKKLNYVIVDKKDYQNYQRLKEIKENTSNLMISDNL